MQIVIAIAFSLTAVAGEFDLREGAVGKLNARMNARHVREAYPDNTRSGSIQVDGREVPTLDVYPNKKATEPDLQIRLVSGQIQGITVLSPKFKTNDGIGVGSTVADLRKYIRNKKYELDEDCNCVMTPGLAFKIDLRGVKKLDGDLSKVPPLNRITSVWVH